MVCGPRGVFRWRAVLLGVLGNIGEIQMNEAITFGMGGVFCAMVAFWLGMSHAQSNMAEECRLVGATRIDGAVYMCSKATAD